MSDSSWQKELEKQQARHTLTHAQLLNNTHRQWQLLLFNNGETDIIQKDKINAADKNNTSKTTTEQ